MLGKKQTATFQILRQKLKPAVVVLTIFICIWYVALFEPFRARGTRRDFESKAASSHGLPKSQDAFDFWSGFSKAMARGKTSFNDIEYLPNMSYPVLTFKDTTDDKERPELLDISKEQIQELRKVHEDAVIDFRELGLKLPFVRGTRGITTTAAMDAMAILTTSLRMLRNSGSKLPVEIWLHKDIDYEESIYMCENVFPLLGATCKVMTNFLPPEIDLEINKKFMFKLNAILFSSFEQVLFLDCDLFPVMNPDTILTTEPFTSHGFVLWPDHWSSTVSKHYYDIVGRKRLPLTERASTESGALLINKDSHAEALLLAAFYNYYGEKIWYRLFSQGAAGEGDKDTFVPAIESYGLPFYQVAEQPQHIGYRCDGKLRAVASGQLHPYDDFRITSHDIWRNHPDQDYISDVPTLRLLFIHGNMPKYEAPNVLGWKFDDFEWFDMLRCNAGKGKSHRMWGPKELAVKKFGWDAEKAVWDSMRWTACEHEHGVRKWVNGTFFSKPTANVCRDITLWYDELLPDERYDPTLTVNRKEVPWGISS